MIPDSGSRLSGAIMRPQDPASAGAPTAPRDYLRAQIRWRWGEIVFWAATLLPFVLTPSYLVLASQIAITALFALSLDLILGFCGIVSLGHAAYFGVGAYTAGLLSKWGFGRAAVGARPCRARRRHIRLSDEFHHRALPPSGLDHADARTCPAASGDRQQRELAHRRLRRDARHSLLADLRPLSLRSLRLHGLHLFADAVVCCFSGCAAADPFAVRAGAARHPRERDPHAGHRRGDARTYPDCLHDCRGDRRHRRRAVGANDRDGLARSVGLSTLGRRAGDADPRRHRAALWRANRRRHLHDRARSILRTQSAILVFLDRTYFDCRGGAVAGRHSRRAVAARIAREGQAVSEIALSARGLYKSFGSLVVASNIELTLPAGARYALIGPNGAGKTTLINLMTGMLRPDAGRIVLDGADITTLPPEQRVRRGLVRTFQINALFPHLTALESVTLAVCERTRAVRTWWRKVSAYRHEIDEAYDILSALSLTAVCHRPTRELAYGQQRLLEIALAMATRPKVLLLDEPAAGVPREDSAELFAAIAGLSRDITVLFIEHDMELVFRFASRVIVLVGGRVLVEGTPHEIASDPQVRAVYLGRQLKHDPEKWTPVFGQDHDQTK